MQLLDCRDFLENESAFMEWLSMGISMASAGVLLLAVGALAYVSPLEAAGLHVAEASALLLLPASCVLVGYGLRAYVWRAARLQSMRHRRVDDAAGPIAMLAVVVLAFAGVLALHAADLIALLRAARGGGGDDDSGGGGGAGGDPPMGAWGRHRVGDSGCARSAPPPLA